MVIGLTGYKGTGKSTVANYLIKEHGFKPINFKDGLVEDMKEKFPDLLELFSNFESTMRLREHGSYTIEELFQDKPPLMRALMQNYGTNVMRAMNPDVWVNMWRSKVGEGKELIVTDDVRFFNELTALKDVGGVLIRVTRDDITSGGAHQSETEQDEFIADFTIVGQKGSHDAVYKQIEDIIHTLKSNVD